MINLESPKSVKRQRMHCMEIWGGNRAIDESFEAPGLDFYVHSQPFEDAKAGGDIYYLTSCASGRISRFLLADVSGHGAQAAGMASSLKELLRGNVNKISQENFVSAMNQKFGALSDQDGFATAIVATFFAPTQTLDISVAGHPYPLYFQSAKNRWVHLDPASGDAGFENMPLGIVSESQYPGRKIKTNEGDMFLLYSDAFIESQTECANDKILGVKGLLECLNECDVSPDELIPCLREKIGSFDHGNLRDDDATLILGHFTKTKVLMRDNFLAPVRLFRDVGDATKLL